MKTFKLNAAKIEMEDNPFTGSMDVKIPNVKERMELIKESNLLEATKSEAVEAHGVDLVAKLSEYVVAVDLSVGENRITDVDELTCYAEGMKLFNAVGQYVMNGLPLGNDLRLC